MNYLHKVKSTHALNFCRSSFHLAYGKAQCILPSYYTNTHTQRMQYFHFSSSSRTMGLLQDKWKTLVHTARISPQQRRGEPVPQELLDRVLAAHAYWSQHQCKHQLKPLWVISIIEGRRRTNTLLQKYSFQSEVV